MSNVRTETNCYKQTAHLSNSILPIQFVRGLTPCKVTVPLTVLIASAVALQLAANTHVT